MRSWPTRLFYISAVLVGVAALLLVVWLSARVRFNPANVSLSEAAPLVVAIGVLVALYTLAANHRREESEEFLDAATDLLEKAFAVLDSNKDDQGRPRNNRLDWLTAARLIKSAEHVSALITFDSHQRLWGERLEYWRGRFYDLLKPNSGLFPPDYYAQEPKHMLGYVGNVREPLSERSLAVLYRFIDWPKDLADPIRNVERFSDEEIAKMNAFGPRGLGKLLERVRQIENGTNPTLDPDD